MPRAEGISLDRRVSPRVAHAGSRCDRYVPGDDILRPLDIRNGKSDPTGPRRELKPAAVHCLIAQRVGVSVIEPQHGAQHEPWVAVPCRAQDALVVVHAVRPRHDHSPVADLGKDGSPGSINGHSLDRAVDRAPPWFLGGIDLPRIEDFDPCAAHEVTVDIPQLQRDGIYHRDAQRSLRLRVHHRDRQALAVGAVEVQRGRVVDLAQAHQDNARDASMAVHVHKGEGDGAGGEVHLERAVLIGHRAQRALKVHQALRCHRGAVLCRIRAEVAVPQEDLLIVESELPRGSIEFVEQRAPTGRECRLIHREHLPRGVQRVGDAHGGAL
mmetsp:Transcript_6504/g.22427  ORF Transcript_6504/g.22427 Transcript_6504/m.22427 type:complete len:326 (+) Transcript_6504:6925-7902(+)